jgi:2-phosphosulfolactate phosphatase
MTFDQSSFEIRFEWGLRGVENFVGSCDAIIIIDVLSFSTCVDIAVGRGARVYPFQGSDQQVLDFAKSVGALPAGRRGSGSPSLSPASLDLLEPGSSLVLPSPNGSRLSLACGTTPTFTGCLRNAEPVARAAATFGNKIGVVAAGERWKPDHSLRPALEDLLGAGAVIHHLDGSMSPEAEAAAAVFRNSRSTLEEQLLACSSGRELVDLGYQADVHLAAQLNVSGAVPFLFEGVFTDANKIELIRRS